MDMGQISTCDSVFNDWLFGCLLLHYFMIVMIIYLICYCCLTSLSCMNYYLAQTVADICVWIILCGNRNMAETKIVTNYLPLTVTLLKLTYSEWQVNSHVLFLRSF